MATGPQQRTGNDLLIIGSVDSAGTKNWLGKLDAHVVRIMSRTNDKMRVLPPQPRWQRLDERRLRLWAPAKINLDLLVGAVMADGFHRLDSRVAKITFYDQIDLHLRDDGEITFTCSHAPDAEQPNCGPDEDNLALRAAGLMCQGRSVAGADVTLVKHIPPGKGLGGGSSDAAAMLMGLNELWSLHLPMAELAEMAEQLGSDVPLFLGPSAVRITGRGENITPIAVRPFCVVLYLPAGACPTGDVYRTFDQSFGDTRSLTVCLPIAGQVAARGEAALPPSQADDERANECEPKGAATVRERADTSMPSSSRPAASTLSESPPSRWRGQMTNDLSLAASVVCSEMAEARERLSAAVGPPVCVTGSGSGLFVLCDDQPEAAAVAADVPDDMKARCLIAQSNTW